MLRVPLPPELAALDIRPPWTEECAIQRMVHTENGESYPLLSLKGYYLYNNNKRHLLCIGNRRASKSIAIANKVVRHMWENDGAIVAVVCRTAKNAKIGVWRDLVNFVIPGWADKETGCNIEIIKQGIDATSKMEYLRIRNQWGTVSEVQLHSIDHSGSAEAKLKGARFSMAWLSEADQFEERVVFDAITDQLRIVGLPYEQHQIICDCNWPEEGDDSWLFEVFEKSNQPDTKYYRANYHDEFEIIKFSLAENPFLDPREKEDLKRKYAHDPIKYQRYVEGDKWVKDVSSGHFDHVFLPNIHVVGKIASANKAEWETITPSKSVRFIITGTDPGAVSNHACSFLAPWTNEDGAACFDIFDEVCMIGSQVPVKKFASEIWERIQRWQEWMVKEYKLNKPPLWHHFADNSVAGYEARSNRTDVQIFHEVSKGNIILTPVPKGQNSIQGRIDMVKRLFFDDRLRISAQCEWNIAWARFLRPGKKKGEIVSGATNKYKHSFDATSYALRAVVGNEFFNTETPTTATGIITT